MPKPPKYLKSAKPAEDCYLGSYLIASLNSISEEDDGAYLLMFKRDIKETQGIFLEREKSLIGGDRGEMVTSTLINVDCQVYIYGLESTIKKYLTLGDKQIYDYLPEGEKGEISMILITENNEVTHYSQVSNCILLGDIGLFPSFKKGSGDDEFGLTIPDAFLKSLKKL